MEQKPNMDIEERNATLDEDELPVYSDDDADKLRDELLEESGMNGFQKFIARMDDHKWVVVQWITGVVLGLIAAVALFWDTLASKTSEGSSSGSIFTIPLVIAIVVAMIVPNIIEKQGLRRAPKLRVALVIALLVAIVAYMIYVGATTGFKGV